MLIKIRATQFTHFYIIPTVCILTVNITLPDKIYITLYLDEIPPDHISWGRMILCTFLTELEQLLSFAWNCSLLYSFNITITFQYA